MTRPYNVIDINGFVVPATFHDALKKILHDVSTGRIHSDAHRSYRVRRPTTHGLATPCMCAIGTFFTDEQLDRIKEARTNGVRTWTLADKFGHENFEAMTGMPVRYAAVIQSDFDYFTSLGYGAIHRFGDRVRLMLNQEPNKSNPATERTGKWHFPVSMSA
jgi:hypothetical protein